jgi:chemotaxis protein methyltransferase CheR
MTATIATPEVARFRALLADRLGLAFDEHKLATLARVLDSCGDDRQRILADLAGSAPADSLLARLASELTVTETYFHRNGDQLRAFAEVALPQRQQLRGVVEVLSAGCASGEEPYTLAMLARSYGRDAGLALHAFDANPSMLARAARGRYSTWSMRELPADLRAAWFRHDGEHYVLAPEIQRAVHFEQRNLALDDPQFWQPCRFDIVFCRNVLMYFTPAQAQAAVARIAHALAPGGYLFLGHAETLRGLSNDFHLCHTHGTFYYQRKDGPLQDAREPLSWSEPALRPAAPAFVPAAPLREAATQDTLWAERIERASRRIDVLASSTRAPMAAAPSAPDLQLALASLHEERFVQALEHIGNLPPEHADDPDVLLLKAVTLVQAGAVARARDALHAGAHYVLALCEELDGDFESALGHYQGATYLAPGFAMARLQAGRLQRRLGQRDAARRELAMAEQLLEGEDAARLLLFGGGFPRAALLALCRSELAALGGAP